MAQPTKQTLTTYLECLLGKPTEILHFGPMGERPQDTPEGVKAFGYGKPYTVRVRVDHETKEYVLDTIPITQGFGHDHRADRASNLVLSYDTWDKLPDHARITDLGAIMKDGQLKSLGGFEELFLLRQKVKGTQYRHDLDALYEGKALTDLDLQRARALAEYIAEVHSHKKEAPHLYVRKIRDTVGHGECIFGLADSYPRKTDFLRPNELEELEKKCVEHRWHLMEKPHRLSQVHGDYHPWNVLFHQNTTRFTLLDRSRGEFGEPADDIASMSINYIFFSLRKHGDLRDEFETLYQTFMNHYLAQTGDREIQETLPLFYTFRCLVVASPLWYPSLTPKTRRQLLNLAHNTLDEKRFNPRKVNSYIQ